MNTSGYLTLAAVLVGLKISLLVWMFTEVSVLSIGLTWLAVGFAATLLASVFKDLKQ